MENTQSSQIPYYLTFVMNRKLQKKKDMLLKNNGTELNEDNMENSAGYANKRMKYDDHIGGN